MNCCVYESREALFMEQFVKIDHGVRTAITTNHWLTGPLNIRRGAAVLFVFFFGGGRPMRRAHREVWRLRRLRLVQERRNVGLGWLTPKLSLCQAVNWDLGTERTCPQGFTRRGQRRFHVTEQVVKFDHDTVITSIPCPVGDEGENTSRGVRIVSAAYGNTEPPPTDLLPHRLRISANLVPTRY